MYALSMSLLTLGNDYNVSLPSVFRQNANFLRLRCLVLRRSRLRYVFVHLCSVDPKTEATTLTVGYNVSLAKHTLGTDRCSVDRGPTHDYNVCFTPLSDAGRLSCACRGYRRHRCRPNFMGAAPSRSHTPPFSPSPPSPPPLPPTVSNRSVAQRRRRATISIWSYRHLEDVRRQRNPLDKARRRSPQQARAL